MLSSCIYYAYIIYICTIYMYVWIHINIYIHYSIYMHVHIWSISGMQWRSSSMVGWRLVAMRVTIRVQLLLEGCPCCNLTTPKPKQTIIELNRLRSRPVLAGRHRKLAGTCIPSKDRNKAPFQQIVYGECFLSVKRWFKVGNSIWNEF